MTTRSTVVADGATALFSVPFPFISRSHVVVSLDGVETSAFSWLSDSQIQFTTTPAFGVEVEVRRVTPEDALVAYTRGSALPLADLEMDSRQALYRLQELDDDKIDWPDDVVPLAPVVFSADGNSVGSGSTELTGDMLLRPNLAAGTDDLFQQSGLGMVLRGFLHKMRDLVHADDRGLVGDGVTDETAALQALFNAAQGKVLMLGYGKTYAIATATGLTIPANTTLIANGSKFKRLTARSGALTDAEYNITVGDDCEIDRLEVEAVGGASDIGGVILSGNRIRIGTIKVTAGSSGSGSLGSLWNAVRVGTNSGKSYDVHVDRIECSNWDRPIFVRNVERFSIGYVSVTTYARGVCFDNCAHGVLRGGYIRTISPNATGTAGENGVLFDCSLAHGETHDIRVCNVTVEDSGEHGYRIGGTFLCRNIWHVNCHAKNPGAGTTGVYPPNNNGGCGFKALGPTSVLGARHQNIHYINCSVEDINATSIANLVARAGKSNFAGFQLGKVFGGSIVNPIVLKRPSDSGTYAETGNSCFNGIEIIGCQKITVTNPQIQRPYNSGVYIYDFSDGTNDWGQTDDIDILGGHVQTPGVAGLEVVCSVITMRRVTVKGLQVNGGAHTVKVAKSGAGAFASCHADVHSTSATTETFNGLGTDWTVSGTINGLVGTSAAKNGSMYQDTFNGNLVVRKAGAWTAL